LRVDPTLTADRLAVVVDLLDDVVPVAVAAGRLARLDPTAQAPPRLVRQVLEVERTHGALEPDVQLVDLALGEGDDLHAQEAHPLVDMGDVLLVAGQAVQRFGHDDVELAGDGVLQELPDSGPDQAGAGDRLIVVPFSDEPAFLRRILLAHAQLVGDRRLPLQVGAVADIHGDGW
jgi:hypothetical protein